MATMMKKIFQTRARAAVVRKKSGLRQHDLQRGISRLVLDRFDRMDMRWMPLQELGVVGPLAAVAAMVFTG